MGADATEGNNIRACDSHGGTVRGVSAGPDLVFEPDDPTGIEQGIINAFYLGNFLHDFFYLLGFDETVGNFQHENPPGVGGGGDSLTVVVRDRIVDGWAFFDNRPDGTSPALELGRFHNSRHTALDADIVVHEFVHGVTNRMIGGKGVQAPLEHEQSLALGEGFSDYYAISIQNHYRRKAAQGAPEDSEEWGYAEWLTGGPPGLRTASYRNYPNAYGFIRGSKMKPHKAGEVWCATLLDLNRALGEGDRDVGDERGWQLVFDSLAFLHPGDEGPTFLHARDAIFCTYEALVQKGTIPGTAGLRSAVCKVFQDRGMGGSATSDGARYRDARESFDPIDMTQAGGCT
jgi:extracellular elastinolytic metalloproteinase